MVKDKRKFSSSYTGRLLFLYLQNSVYFDFATKVINEDKEVFYFLAPLADRGSIISLLGEKSDSKIFVILT